MIWPFRYPAFRLKSPLGGLLLPLQVQNFPASSILSSNYLQIRFPGNTWSENASVTHINNNKLLFFNKRQTVLQITRVIRKRRDLPPCPPTAGSIYHCFLSLMEARNVYRASHSEPRSMISPLRLSFNNSLFQLFSQFRECGKTSKHLSMVSGELRTSQVELVSINCLSM